MLVTSEVLTKVHTWYKIEKFLRIGPHKICPNLVFAASDVGKGNGKKGKGKSEMGKGSSGGQVMMRERMTLALFQVTTTIGVGTQ